MALKPLSARELEFARLLQQGVGSIQAARLAMKWKCESGTTQYNKAKDLARSVRIRKEIERLREAEGHVAKATAIVSQSNKLDLTNLRQFAFDRLTLMRDDPDIPAKARYMAITALERLNDPSKDVNLIYRWIDLMWRYYTGHCPACHADFPLWQVKNERLTRYRDDHQIEPDKELHTEKERRLGLIQEAEKLRHPHPGQVRALAAPERHIVGTGAARAGKSFTLAMFCLMYLMIPGVELWVLARVYDDAEPEFKYLEGFLKTLFNPVTKHIVDVHMDSKSGEAYITTRWGSVIQIKSGKSQGSITGRELEFAGVAEPSWVDGKLYEELRARMSSRLGRIIALGTPKGFGTFTNRMVKQAGRGPDGKIRPPEDRQISRGCPWEQSLLFFNYDPTDNPSYVRSELITARSELTMEEYASEFEGLTMAAEGARFPCITQRSLVNISREQYNNCVFVMGIDQGPKNFGGCLVGYDGHKVYTAWEFHDNSDTTIRSNLITLNYKIPPVIFNLGGNADNWQLTIFDADPPIFGTLEELAMENKKWKTEETYRPKNQKDLTNWREETMEWINSMAKQNRFFFDAKECDMLHDQIREALIKPRLPGKDSTPGNDKGWIVQDLWRGDHVMDAWLMACYCIMSGMLSMPLSRIVPEMPYQEHQRQSDYDRLVAEKQELQGFEGSSRRDPEAEAWRTVYGQERRQDRYIDLGDPGYYDGES
jgi:hypothetical protein